MQPDITTNDTTAEPPVFRWTGQELVITGPTSQLIISAEHAYELLTLLDAHRSELMQGAHQQPLPDWTQGPAGAEPPSTPGGQPHMSRTELPGEEDTGK